ncbi:MAG: acetyl-CoA acetyltransferase, partial [Gammaproteobacteria bacterium]
MEATRIPVLVGIGTATQREEDWRRAREPLDLMLDAVRAAAADSGAPALLTEVDYLAVPHGRWHYRNPGGALAREVGARHAQSVFATVGVLQQSLIGEACARIAAGKARATLVVGGDCGYRLLRASIAGDEVQERQQDDLPDVHLAPKDALFHPVEQALGLTMPIGLYALIESAWRQRHGWSLAEHRARLGALYARFSDIAADNPHAWRRERRAATDIVAPGPRNPMQAFPYTRALCSTFNVDQAGALLFCSAARADELGIGHERRVYPLASTESNHQVSVSARADLTACPGARLAGQRALDTAGLLIDEIDLVELYSCFPAAVEIYAAELGIDLARDVT